MSLKPVLLLSCALLGACSVFSPKGPSDVARGEYYSAGKPEFDSFFIGLYEKQVKLLAAPVEPREARKSLTQALGLTSDASDEALKSRLDAEVKKLAAQGLRVRLEVPSASTSLDASATLHSSEASTATPLRTLLPTEATRLVRSRNAMLATRNELDKLSVTGITLDSRVEQAFRVEGPWKRDEVRQNLADGQKLITLMKARAQEVLELDERLLGQLSEVASTDPSLGQPLPAVVTPVDEGPKPSRRSGRGVSRLLARPSSTVAVAGASSHPSPAPARSRREEDGAPAPKPTQGSAPAEIEP